MSSYDDQARKFLDQYGFKLCARRTPRNNCPTWCDPAGTGCKHQHGDEYRVTITREPGTARIHRIRSVSFRFWNSQNDAKQGRRPSAYTILACVSSDAHSPTDPDEVVREFGAMPPSQALAAAAFTKRLQAFFTEAELGALAEIQ